MAYNCPKKNLHIGLEHEEELEPEKDEQNQNSFDYGVYDPTDLDDKEVDISLASVVRHILAAPKVEEEDRRRTSIFQMLVRCGNQAQKLIVDSGSCMNVVSASMVERLKLPVEPHPQPYKVAWINNMSIPVNQHCLVSLSCGIYSDSIWCDVIPMKVAHIILGRPWLYDRDVHHCGKENTYSFMFKNQKVGLKPMTAAEMGKYRIQKSTKAVEGMKSSLHILIKKKFQHESKENEVIYVVIMKEVGMKDAGSISSIPKKAIELLNDFSDIALADLPSERPPLRNIQHSMDFMSVSQLPNLPAFRMNPIEYAELKRQVGELLSKGFIRESLSPCVVPALLTPKKDGSWRMCVDSRVINKIAIKYRFPFLGLMICWI